MWGSAFTSVTFAKLLHPLVTKKFREIIITFTVFSTIVFLIVGKPVKVLIAAGAINGLILPFALSIILPAAHKKILPQITNTLYWLSIAGWIVVLARTCMGIKAIAGLI